MNDIIKIKALREETGVSIALCQKALKEAKNDLGKARELLQKMGLDLADKKKNKETQEGVISSYVHHNKRVGAMLVLKCETDFVAKNADFQKLAYEISMQVASMQPKDIATLLKQDYIRDNSKTIEILIKESISKLGENIQVSEFTRFSL